MQAEGLLGLYQNDRTPAPHVRKWRRLGACLKHCSHLKGYGGLWVNMQKTRLEMTPIHLPNFNRALAEGRRIPLTVAIRRWNEL